jgi:catechol 2,3-dioxygenase-like lactoylglutathione lyase family enzyme
VGPTVHLDGFDVVRSHATSVRPASGYRPEMSIELRKDSIDLGIVIEDSARSLAFYRDLLGFEHVSDTPMPPPLAGTMHRLMCGTTLIKLVKLDEVPSARPAPGGLGGGTGYRYFTITISNLAEVTSACRDAGARIVVDNVELRPGLMVSIVEDPDGNWVEFIDPGD